MFTPSALTTNLNRNKSLPLKQATIGGQIIPQRPPTDSVPNASSKSSEPPRAAPAQPPLPNVEQLPKWNNEEIDKRLAESAKLLQEWTDLMNKTGKFSYYYTLAKLTFSTDRLKAEEVSTTDLRRHYELVSIFFHFDY